MGAHASGGAGHGLAGEKVDHADDNEEGKHAGDAEDANHRYGVSTDRRIIAAAVEDEEVDWIADLLLASVQECQA